MLSLFPHLLGWQKQKADCFAAGKFYTGKSETGGGGEGRCQSWWKDNATFASPGKQQGIPMAYDVNAVFALPWICQWMWGQWDSPSCSCSSLPLLFLVIPDKLTTRPQEQLKSWSSHNRPQGPAVLAAPVSPTPLPLPPEDLAGDRKGLCGTGLFWGQRLLSFQLASALREFLLCDCDDIVTPLCANWEEFPTASNIFPPST